MNTYLEAALGLMSPVQQICSAFTLLRSTIKHLRSKPQATSILAAAKRHIKHHLVTA